MIDLQERYCTVIKKLSQQYLAKGSELRVYGSRVKGNAIESSDLDLAIFTPKGEINDVISFRNALQSSNIPIFIQVFDWNDFPAHFKRQFKQNNELLFVVE